MLLRRMPYELSHGPVKMVFLCIKSIVNLNICIVAMMPGLCLSEKFHLYLFI